MGSLVDWHLRKEYMAKHPGGQDILLGVLGGDATVEQLGPAKTRVLGRQFWSDFCGSDTPRSDLI